MHRHICFLLLVSLFLHFLVVVSVLTHVGFREHVNIASPIVSYRTYCHKMFAPAMLKSSRRLWRRRVLLRRVGRCELDLSCPTPNTRADV